MRSEFHLFTFRELHGPSDLYTVGWGHVHMCNQKNAQNCGFIPYSKYFRGGGVNLKCAYIKKEGFFLDSFRSNFSNSSISPNIFRKISCLGALRG